MSGFTEWLGRVIMLVLAGMITLSIIGAIAAIPSGSIGTRLATQPQDWTAPPGHEEEAAPPTAATNAASSGRESSPSMAGHGEFVAAPKPTPAATAADWLEAITYALLALVGLGVAGILLLWRSLLHWRRSAEALEALAARRL